MIRFVLKHKNQFWLLGAMLVAFALRVYALRAQSLWNDEGTSVALSQLSLEAITNGAARDIHPPLYYYLLHFWMPFAGESEFAVRFLSVIAGVLTVAVTFRIAYVFLDEEVAIIAAYLSAFSPFQVYYSQEARMYVWVMLWGAVSVLAFVKLIVKSQKAKVEFPIWLVYITATIATLYTQYVGAFVVVAQNLAFAVWLFFAIRNSQFAIRPLAHWLIGQFIIAAAFAPWYLFAGGQLAAWPSISEPLDLPTLLWRVLNVFSVGITLDAGASLLIATAFGILFFAGWRRARDANTNWVITALILWTLVPVAAMYIVSLSRPAYNPKFLLLSTPAFFILAARGVAQFAIRNSKFKIRITNLSFVICSFVILAASLPSLRNYYFDPQYARDDYRAIMRFIDSNARAGDGILVDAPAQIDVVRYYWSGDQQLYLLPRMRPPEPNATHADIDEMLGKVKRLFAIFYATEQSDPQAIIDTRLAERAFKARDEWHGNVRLAIYGVAPNPRGAPQPINVKVGDEITLVGYQIDQREARAGDVLTLTLNWRAEQSPSMRYKVFVHLLDANNRVVAQRDGEPASDTRITTTWRAGEIIADNFGVFIKPGTPLGDYRIEIGVYRADTGARLLIGEIDHLMAGTMQVK